MKSFKQFFLESAESEADLPPPPEKFQVPPPRAKFQRGDVVIVQNPQPDNKDYLTQHLPKYMHGYINAVGRILGHRTIGIDTQFAVEFEDKTIGKIRGYYLVGPFRSIQTAKKYQGRDELVAADIAPEDHKRYAEAKSEMGANETIENAFKKLFVEEGYFEWLPEPIVIKVAGVHKAAILAISKASIFDEQRGGHYGVWEKVPQIANKAFFCKAIDVVSSQLIKTSAIVDYGSSSYGLVVPSVSNLRSNCKFKNGKVVDVGIYYKKAPVTSVKVLAEYKAEYEKLAALEAIEDGMELFDLINNVQVKENIKIVPKTEQYSPSPEILEEITTNLNAFKNYVFEGDVKCSCNINGQIVFPKEVKGNQITIVSNKTIENLKGFPITHPKLQLNINTSLNCFEGLPSTFEGNMSINSVSSLDGFPKVVKGNCVFGHVDSFKGGQNSVIEGSLSLRSPNPPSFKNIPEAKDYLIYGRSQESLDKIKEVIRQRKYVDKQLSSDWNVNLDDFS